jgi:acetoin utilization deacetylase AcuC-like enzyme
MDNRKTRIGIAYDEAFLRHDTGPWHPESPERLKAVMETINSMSIGYEIIEPREASGNELVLIHDPTYVEAILNLDPRGTVMLDPDTAYSPDTRTAVLKAVGAVLDAVDEITEGKINRAFCPVRPPGHHAEPARAMGFCIFNNIAVGAAYAITKKGIDKAAIIDWDVHHGNGTQKAFYRMFITATVRKKRFTIAIRFFIYRFTSILIIPAPVLKAKPERERGRVTR